MTRRMTNEMRISKKIERKIDDGDAEVTDWKRGEGEKASHEKKPVEWPTFSTSILILILTLISID